MKKAGIIMMMLTVWLVAFHQPQIVMAAGLTEPHDNLSRGSAGEEDEPHDNLSRGGAGEEDKPHDNLSRGGADGDNALTIDSISTAFSEETPSVISVTASVPEHFGLAAYAEIVSLETGITYNLPLYASNGYYQRCYVPAGTYYVGNIAVYDDTANDYPFDFLTADFMLDANDSYEIKAMLADYETVEEKVEKKRGEDAGAVQDGDEPQLGSGYQVATDFPVAYSGTGSGCIGITGEQTGRYEIVIRITQSGYLGNGHFNYSLDGGKTWHGEKKGNSTIDSDLEIPLSGFYDIPATGLTVEFYVSFADEAGFLEGDIYSAFIPDPSTSIRSERKGRGSAKAEVVSLDPGISAFDALEASGMDFVVKIEKGGDFGEAIWMVSTDGGRTFGPQEFAVEEIRFEDAGLLLHFYRETDGTLFVRGDRHTVSAVRQKSGGVTGLFLLLAFLLFGGLGYGGFVLNSRLKAMKPKESDYRICGR